MNELVRGGSGILLAPHHTFSHDDPPVPVLGKYGNISASMSPEVSCSRLVWLLLLLLRDRWGVGLAMVRKVSSLC
jgi:hypothetical protein